MQQTKKATAKPGLYKKLASKGISAKLASMIGTLNEEIRGRGKEIMLKDNKLWICEKEKPAVQIGDLSGAHAFVYDSKIFLEEGDTAVCVFNRIFLNEYMELMATLVPMKDWDDPYSDIPVPEFHSFIISFNCNGDMLDIALLNDKMGVVAFASTLCRQAEKECKKLINM